MEHNQHLGPRYYDCGICGHLLRVILTSTEAPQVKAKKPVLNKAVARKVLAAVDAGLVHGLGDPVPGQMCVEAAVCYALGQPHGDDPNCVSSVVRTFKIKLNDSAWSSNSARAKGMRRVAVAQLGSNKIDNRKFAKELVLGTVKTILPFTFRGVAAVIPSHKEALEAAALACEVAKDLSAADSAASAAHSAAYSAASAASAADSAAYSAASAAHSAARDNMLSMAAEVAVKALKKCGALGVKWLDLCK